jgi:hypothetical protein
MLPLTAQGFVSKWNRVTARKKSTYQEDFIDLCQCAGPAGCLPRRVIH